MNSGLVPPERAHAAFRRNISPKNEVFAGRRSDFHLPALLVLAAPKLLGLLVAPDMTAERIDIQRTSDPLGDVAQLHEQCALVP